MKVLKFTIALFILSLGALASTTASAHGHGRASFGFYFGGPGYWYPGPYYSPYYRPYYDPYYAPQVVVPGPVQYVEQSPPPAQAAAAPPPPQSYWYYCQDSGAYYPNVKECASQWQRVPPRP